MKQELRKTKIKVLSEEHNKAIQEAVFAAGGEWQHSGRIYQIDVNFIFLNDSLVMTLCDNAVFFQEHDYKEIQLPLPIKAIYTKLKEETQMKQIIVNVGDLTIEEKQRVNEALAKIQNVPKIEDVTTGMAWFYAPSYSGLRVGWNSILKSEVPTHTPQQVLEMAGMTTKRKVRKDFNPAKEYNVNVKECTEEEKKEVQQAFFDAGFIWKGKGAKYGHPSALQYTNKYDYGDVSIRYLYEGSAEGCNMTAKEFLNLVYEPEQQGHIHAELMALYAEDAKTHVEPWKLWEIYHPKGGWRGIGCNPTWASGLKYRRKPKTHIVHGAEIPELRVTPEHGDCYYLANPTLPELTELHQFVMSMEKLWVERGLTYQHTEEGKQAAILHSKAMLGID